MVNVERSSINDVGREAVMQHKWLESEKAGHDLGEHAIYDWIHRYWHAFYRARAIEHLLGSRRWIEMDDSEFGILFVELAKQPGLAKPILQHLLKGADNLTILHWANTNRLPLEVVYRALTITNRYRYTGWSTITFAEYVVRPHS